MNRAQRRALQLRRKLRLHGRVDAQAVADMLGIEIVRRPLRELQEMKIDGVICIALRLEPEWSRWLIAHAIGHELMHPGNHLWLRKNTGLAHKYEREAEDFAHALLLDAQEAVDRGLTNSSDLAYYFGVPEEVVRLQPRLRLN